MKAQDRELSSLWEERNVQMTQVSSLKSSVLSHFIPMGTGGQGIDLAAINLHCSAFAFLPAYCNRKIFWRNWHICAEREIKSIGRRVCSWTNKINPVSVFILRVSETASSRLQTLLSLTKTSRTSRFSHYHISFQKAWNLIQCSALGLFLPKTSRMLGFSQ